VSLGSAAENIEAAVDYMRETRGAKVGSIHPNVFRPFPEAAHHDMTLLSVRHWAVGTVHQLDVAAVLGDMQLTLGAVETDVQRLIGRVFVEDRNPETSRQLLPHVGREQFGFGKVIFVPAAVSSPGARWRFMSAI
jgi:hypothetical protein